ncbi:MAG: hypothetical protein ACJASL_000894 [Paraglaciecola sp.]|jgi:hypothetical protein
MLLLASSVTNAETSAPQQESIAKAEPAAMAKPVAIPTDKKHYSPSVGDTFPNNVFFGDTHLHTSYSTDAGMVGNTLGPEEAYRIARGETVKASFGEYVKLKRPLDFVVISDHAENLGLAPAIREGNPILQKNEWGKKIVKHANTPGEFPQAFDMFVAAITDGKNPLSGTGLEATYWQKSTAAAERFNEPGKFTAFIGFEWTSVPGGSNLHRNVIFRGDKSKADNIVPLSSYDTVDPEKLWEWMADYEKKTGGKMLAIPHNGNVSQGLMFDDVTLTSKKPLDKSYAENRMRWEPLYEITQMKGDGEAHPFLSPDDEFADFETWDSGSFGPNTTTKEHWPREYAREAFKRGLAYEKSLGVNPFKFGVVGSTDSHTSVPSAEEDNYFGKVSLLEPGRASEDRYEETIIGRPNPDKKSQISASRVGASGLAAVWARDNTREALWDAMKRKEVYGTTGTRLKVRVFGGFDFAAADIDRMDFAEEGYKRGVPMGGDLTTAPSGKAPGFLVRALRDPDGANIDRVQIIKGWLDAKGETQEKVYDLAVSDGRNIGADGRCKDPVGNTVNVKGASYSNSIGDAYQQAYWQDPAFDAKQKAFYYVRVIEIPTPRWTTYDAKHFGRELPHDVPASIQERAYTSPIWYTPK